MSVKKRTRLHIHLKTAGRHLARLKPKPHHWRWGGLVTAALVAAVVFFVIGACMRLLMGPVSLGPFSGRLASSINEALPGLAVRYDEAALEWSRDEGRVNLVILGARVFNSTGRIIAQAPKAEIVLAAAPFLQGKVEIKSIALVGVQLTLVRAKDGHLHLGMEREQGQSDVLEQIREAISKSSKGASSLQSFAVKKARLAFYDEGTGLFVVAPEAQLEVSTGIGTEQHAGQVEASVDAQIEISGHRAHVLGDVKLPQNAGNVTGDVSITGLDISALGTNTKAFAFLQPYALVTDLTGSFTLDHATSVRYADFGLSSAGMIIGFGPLIHVKSLKLLARYDGATGRLLIDDGSLEGSEARAHLGGFADLAFKPDGTFDTAKLELLMDKFAVNMHGVTSNAVTLTRVSLRGAFVAADQRFSIDQFLVTGGPVSAELTGAITFASNQSPGVDLDGKIAQMDVRDALHYWPLQVGEGARDWIDANVSAGKLGPIIIKTRIKAGALDQPVLPEDALNISLTLSGGTMNYIRGLTPITQAQATGLLTGDTFTGDLASGRVGALRITTGHVVIPNLHVTGSAGDFTAHAEGSVPDVLTLIDMKPLNYPSRFHVKTEGAKGTASVDLSFHVPMLKALTVDDIGISVKGAMHDLAIAMGEQAKISDGQVDFSVDNSNLHANGTVELGGAKLAIDWTEAFKTKNDITTLLTVKGMVDDNARTALNFRAGDFLTGPVNVSATLQGHRGVLRSAQATLDLTPATVMLDLINYRKPEGTAATAQMNAQFTDSGDIASEDITVSGAGFSAKGSANFGADGSIQHLEFPMVHAGPANDFAVELTDTPATGFVVSVSGHSADGTGLGRRNPNSSANNNAQPNKAPPTEPFHISARLDHVLLREGVSIAPFAFDTSGVGDKPQSFSMSGVMAKGATLSANLTNDGGTRQIKFNSTDAGQLIKGLFGFTSIRGGTLDVNAALSPSEKRDSGKGPVDFSGSIVIHDFKVTNQPFLARLFSAASFGGFADLLRGDGIGVDKMEVPFMMHGGVLDIHDARAAGPSLSITADGYLDRRSNQIALEGAFAPLSGINSILGAIPVVGDVLISKKGEGFIGMSYAVNGNADEPNISVNPLSVLAPGIFRRLFEGVPHAPPAEANTSTAPPPPKGP